MMLAMLRANRPKRAGKDKPKQDGEDMEQHCDCGGLGVLMGVLGRLVWYRCRDCGWEFSRLYDAIEDYSPTDGNDDAQ